MNPMMPQGNPMMQQPVAPIKPPTAPPSKYVTYKRGDMWVVSDETGQAESSFKTRPEAIRRINMLNGEERRQSAKGGQNAMGNPQSGQPMGGL